MDFQPRGRAFIFDKHIKRKAATFDLMPCNDCLQGVAAFTAGLLTDVNSHAPGRLSGVAAFTAGLLTERCGLAPGRLSSVAAYAAGLVTPSGSAAPGRLSSVAAFTVGLVTHKGRKYFSIVKSGI